MTILLAWRINYIGQQTCPHILYCPDSGGICILRALAGRCWSLWFRYRLFPRARFSLLSRFTCAMASRAFSFCPVFRYAMETW